MGQLLKEPNSQQHENAPTPAGKPAPSYAFFDVLTQLTLEQKRQRAAQRAAR